MENSSKKVFLLRLVSADRQMVDVLDADDNGDTPISRGSIPVGPAPGKVAVQVAAP